jgi:hypothetical protein
VEYACIHHTDMYKILEEYDATASAFLLVLYSSSLGHICRHA